MRDITNKSLLINGLQLNEENSGVQYYTNNLLDSLDKKVNNFKISVLISNNNFSKSKTYKNIQLQTVNFNSGTRIKRIFFENFELPKLFRRKQFNVYHATNYVLPYYFNSLNILTVHDLIALDFPALCKQKSAIYFNLLLARSIKKARHIIVPSITVKNDILARFNIDPDKINVIYHGINQNFRKINDKKILDNIKLKYALPEKYILFVGNIEPKKNLQRLINAFYLLRKTSELKHKLIIVGKKGWKYRPVFKTINDLKIKNEIIFTGYIPEKDLPSVYSLADLFVFPSLYEGFGIPPLEAMACEVPVIVSNRGALPEITGGNCPQINPYSVHDLKEAILRLLTDKELREKNVKQGKKWANNFNWEKAANETLKVYEKTLNTK